MEYFGLCYIVILISCCTDVYDHQDLEPSALPEKTALVGVDQTTLISNEAEAFPLMPIDVSSFGQLGAIYCCLYGTLCLQ